MKIYSLTNYGRPDVRALDDICAAAFNVPIVDTYIDQLHTYNYYMRVSPSTQWW
ncbi:hypothetical protein L915_01554 [Phytophthora nicotianae]|uniref:Uncharacterized protein n=1 Tax=Phytophthora nicotianae TaxID=4792 RepID=W2HJS0_PHYNI|nr:hypothetical protein L915_01554 [Phytophthora nicotianae]ETL48909.1 hypothetical protein L916_01529 [Phytophthora nicotianae]ETM55205.1 hypothetical protein L914_01544 [Phytophthora nicotianae]